MYKLMVVEDEAMIRRGIVNSVPWQTLGFEVACEGKNGKHALDILKTNPVDVLLTDIKMPIMGGIELAKKAREMYPDIEIIILSGFSDFEYARQAISFRAFDYLLKPTNKTKLLNAFTELKMRMDYKRDLKEEIFSSSIYANAGYETMRNDFIEALLEGDKSLFEDFDEKSLLLELDFGGSLYTAATIKFNRKSIYEQLNSSWATDKRLLTFSYNNVIKEALGNIDNSYCVVEDYDTINFIFCFSSEEEQSKLMMSCLESIGENIHHCLFKNVNVPYTIGVGLSYPTIHHISKSFTQAKRSIQNNFYIEEKKIHIYQDNNDSKYEQNFIQFYPEEMQNAAVAISSGNKKDTEKYLIKMFKGLVDKKLLPEIVKNYCISLKFMVQAKLSNSHETAKGLMSKDYNEFVKNAITVNELKAYVLNVMVSLAKEIDETIDSTSINEQRMVIEKAKLFIRDHLSEKVNLKLISEQVYLSETYFSFLFKKVTGVTYIDYIQKLRMNEAKKLLVTTTFKVYEIAEMIGYSDYKYFSVQFKKYVAMTPKDYRNQKRREDEND